jgi:hypothetical protein
MITKFITTRTESITRSAARRPRYAPAHPQQFRSCLTTTRGGHIAALCFRLRSPPDLHFATHTRLLLQPVARRRLGTVRTVLSQLSTKISDFSLEHRDLALQRSDQLIDFGGKIHPTLDSDSQPQVSQVPLIERKFAETVVFRTHPHLGSYLTSCHMPSAPMARFRFKFAKLRPRARSGLSTHSPGRSTRLRSKRLGRGHCPHRYISSSMSPSNNPTNIILESVIRCPSCSFESVEQMPTNACQYLYECRQCGARLKPKPGDCCVFCSYGSVPCPPVQADSSST